MDYDRKQAARALVEEMYQKGIKKLESELTVGNYWQQIQKIEKYKKLHKNRI